MATQHQRQWDGIALSEGDLARGERPDTGRALQAPMSFVVRPWQGIGDPIQKVGRRIARARRSRLCDGLANGMDSGRTGDCGHVFTHRLAAK